MTENDSPRESCCERLRAALLVAARLLEDDGYSVDPDYAKEWQTISEALGE